MLGDLEVLIMCKIGAVRFYSKRSTRLTKANLGAKLDMSTTGKVRVCIIFVFTTLHPRSRGVRELP